ncbi:FecR domain-containing protein [Rapidithrix thailandica]|uniref:FecR domain-containing protein n=1 Tax=Rapidithrix thailandica TaxID=413964 RepID=A0AAW9S8S4_9BACT
MEENYKDDQLWELMARVLDGEATASQRNQLERILEKEQKLKRKFEELKAIRKAKVEINDTNQYNKRSFDQLKQKLETTQQSTKRDFSASGWWQWAAASVVLLLGLGLWWQMNGTEPDYLELTAPVGEVAQYTLPDGSQVWLNAGSSLHYRKDFQDHRETLLQGEGFFAVQKDAEHPFTVNTGSLTTRVLGTSFHIQAYPEMKEEVEVALFTGKVEVEKQGGKVLAVLSPGEQLHYQHEIVAVSTFEQTTVGEWRYGKLNFYQASFEEVIAKLERKFDVEITTLGTAGDEFRLTAKFDEKATLNEVLEGLAYLQSFEYTIHQQNVELRF